ncbi:MAG TPA: prepilin-type N-terminal cleavage/methylation domain-containing protein [Pseudomonas sp.]|nr:prepilin-type N-terminal cleavage/methylation domain-containing protein [Pseudomonas sp.]
MHERKRMSGFSLIEALIAFLIIGVGLLGAAKMQALLTTDSAVSQQRGEAVVVAQDLIERFRSFSALATTSGSVAYADITGSAAAETVAGVNASYSRSWTVEECCIDQTSLANACPAANCGSSEMRWKNLSVTVAWTDKGNTPNSVNLVTKIARLGPSHDSALLVASTPASGSSGSSGSTGSTTSPGSPDPATPIGTGNDPTPPSDSTNTVVTRSCMCSQNGNSGNYSASGGAGCTASCCQAAAATKCTGKSCSFNTFCPIP